LTVGSVLVRGRCRVRGCSIEPRAAHPRASWRRRLTTTPLRRSSSPGLAGAIRLRSSNPETTVRKTVPFARAIRMVFGVLRRDTSTSGIYLLHWRRVGRRPRRHGDGAVLAQAHQFRHRHLPLRAAPDDGGGAGRRRRAADTLRRKTGGDGAGVYRRRGTGGASGTARERSRRATSSGTARQRGRGCSAAAAPAGWRGGGGVVVG